MEYSKELTLDSIQYLIQAFKANNTTINQDNKRILKCFKYLSRHSERNEFQIYTTDQFEEYIKIIFDIILNLTQNLKKNFNFNFFNLNDSKKENLLMLTRLVGNLLNYSNNSVYISNKLMQANTIYMKRIADLFQLTYHIQMNLNETNENYNQLVCFTLTSLDFALHWFELNKSFHLDSIQKLFDLKSKLLNDEFYLLKLSYYLIDHDIGDKRDQILDYKYNSCIFTLKQLLVSDNLTKIFENQLILSSFNFIQYYSSLFSHFDSYLTNFIVKLLNEQLLILNKSNVCLLIQILLNYSGNNKEFTIEYQKIDKSIFILFKLLDTLIQTNDYDLIENLILLIYFIGKNAFLFQEIWSQCNAMNKLIANVLENKLFKINL